MPRKARIDAPGAIHHIIIRGIEQKPIFKDEQDYGQFIKRLGNILDETSTPCFAWALMYNHVHLLLRTGSYSLSTVMRRLLTGYAQFFNRRHKRHGHLLQNRYKSILCEEEPYLLELVRYIHLNPIRANIVHDLKSLLFQLDKQYITGKGRQMDRVRARDLVSYWSAIELGIPMSDLAKRFGITIGAVSYAVKRGEKVASEGGFRLDG